jgi:cysteine desulfurase/selenocysteine lyase
MDIKEIRRQFPILEKGEIIYFDNAATSLVPRRVAETMLEADLYHRANVGRGISRFTQETTQSFEQAREKIARFLNASPEEIVFVRNATEAINIVAFGLPWKRDDRIITTLVEHHSNFLPWQVAAKKYHLQFEYISPDYTQVQELSPYEQALKKKTKLLSIVYVSNVLGVKLPVKEIARMAREQGALTMVDAAQAVPHFPVNVKDLGVDYLAISAHKMYGPTGIGALYISKDAPKPQPLLVGGGMVADVQLDRYTAKELPFGCEAGTQPIAGALGFAAAVDFINEIGYNYIENRCEQLTGNFDQRLRAHKQIKVYGTDNIADRLGIFAFNFNNCGVHRIASLYDQLGNIVLRSGQHCTMPLHQRLLKATRGTVRASLAFYNTEEEIDKFMDVTERILELMGNA